MRAFHLSWQATLLVLSVATPAAAQEPEWLTGQSDNGVEMMYGTPASDDILFAIRCDAKTKELFVGFAHEPVGVPHGGSIDLTLFSEAGEVVLPAKVSYLDAMDITLIESKTVPAEELRKIVTEGTVLSVMVQDGVEEIPIKGMALNFSTLFSACED